MRFIEKFINKLDLFKLRWNKLVNALITLSENTNRVLNMIKARFGLKDKSEAVEYLVSEYANSSDEPEFKPSFVKEVLRASKHGKFIKVDDFAKEFGLKNGVQTRNRKKRV